MTSKQINIKKELAERLRAYPGSYSAAIEELFKIKEEYGKLQIKAEYHRIENKQLHERIEVLRLAKKRKYDK